MVPLILRALLAAARSRPNMALPTKSIPKSFQPRAALDPLTGKPIPLTRAASGRMNPPVREFTADQVRNARLIGAAVPAGVGAAGAGVANIISSKTDAPASARPPVDTTGMSPEEAALAQQQAESDIDYRKIFSRTPAVTPTERRPSFQRLAQAAAISTNPDPAKAAIGQEVLTPPSSEELLLRKMETASRAAQPSEDLNPNENDIEAALRIARQRALESAYSRENQNRMLSDQNAFRSMEGQPSIVTPAAAAPAAQTSAAPAFPMDGSITGEAYGTPNQRELARAAIQASGMMDSGSGITVPAATRPAARPTARPMVLPPSLELQRQARSEQPSSSFMSRMFGGPEYQSTGERVVKEGGQGVNFGSGENAADFFRADRELRKQRPEMFERQAEARGGAPKALGSGGKDAALHKALEIIHHLLTRGR